MKEWLISDYDNYLSYMTSLDGIQEKWCINNEYYKKDIFGSEGLSEAVVSRIASNTNIDEITHYTVGEYPIKDCGNIIGCKSKNFLKETEEILTIKDLIQIQPNPEEFKNKLSQSSPEDRLKRILFFIHSITKIDNYEIYLSKLLELDYITLNTDRHFGNLAIIRTPYSPTGYKPAPLFDNGLSLLSDKGYAYNLKENLTNLDQNIQVKPFGKNHIQQLEAVDKVIGLHLQFNIPNPQLDITFTSEEIRLYDPYRIERIKTLINTRIKDYISKNNKYIQNEKLTWM